MEMSDSEEEDVVEVKAANSLLPNLTISVDDDDNETPTVEFQEEEESAPKMEEDKSEPTIIKLEPKSFPHTKIYENKALKDMGLSGEEAKMKKLNRAKRFCSPLLKNEDDEKDVEDKKVESLIEKVREYNRTAEGDDLIRLEAVNISGLDEMSTEDIFSFLADQFPSHIEWINDTSCNVIWKDERSAATTIIAMTRREHPAEKKEVKGQGDEVKLKDTEKDDSLDLLDSDDEMDVEEGGDSTAEGGNSTAEGEKKETENKNGDSEANEVFRNDPKRCKKYFQKNGRKVLLKLRFAAVKDKKVLGGAKRSRYYQKYGNPNYGNTKGILSRSFMKRFHGRVAREEFESLNPSKNEGADQDRQSQAGKNSKKPVRKRMYSDLETVKKKRQKMEGSRRTSSGSESDYTSEEEENKQEKEDLDLMKSSAKDLSGARPVKSSDEEEEKDTMMADRIAKREEASKKSLETARKSGNLNVTVKSRNVWSRLGKKTEVTGLKFTVDNRERKDDVRDRLPASLKSRLGSKKRF